MDPLVAVVSSYKPSVSWLLPTKCENSSNGSFSFRPIRFLRTGVWGLLFVFCSIYLGLDSIYVYLSGIRPCTSNPTYSPAGLTDFTDEV